jgi:hypothetical protein
MIVGREGYVTCNSHYRKRGTFLGFCIILGIEEYNGSIFLSTETEECWSTDEHRHSVSIG